MTAVDATATKEARRRHADGIAYLDALFGFTADGKFKRSVQASVWLPYRRTPTAPPVRTLEIKARKRRRNAARLARRRNRP